MSPEHQGVPQKGAAEIFDRVIQAESLSNQKQINGFLRDLRSLHTLGATSIPEVAGYLNTLGTVFSQDQTNRLKVTLMDQLMDKEEKGGGEEDIKADIAIARLLGLDKIPEVGHYLSLVEPEEVERQRRIIELHNRWEEYFATPKADRDWEARAQLCQDTASLISRSGGAAYPAYREEMNLVLESLGIERFNNPEYDHTTDGVLLAANQLGLIVLPDDDLEACLEFEKRYQDKINLAKKEAEEQRIQERYDARSAELNLQDVQGGFFMGGVDGFVVTSLVDPDGSPVPFHFDPEEVEKRLSLVGKYNGNDDTLTVVGGDGRYYVGPMTDENIAALEAAGYRKGPVSNIMSADCRFADPEWQRVWEEMLAEANRSAASLEKEMQDIAKANPKAVADLIRSWLGEKAREGDVSISLTGAQKAAALLIILGQDRASQVFPILQEAEIDTVAAEILKLEKLAPSVITELLEESFEGLAASRQDEDR